MRSSSSAANREGSIGGLAALVQEGRKTGRKGQFETEPFLLSN